MENEKKSFPTRERGLKPACPKKLPEGKKVVPYAGTWIETQDKSERRRRLSSFPTRERGLKPAPPGLPSPFPPVVPYAGTWIETQKIENDFLKKTVVPYAGTWIETGLGYAAQIAGGVVPYAGTWIETRYLEAPIYLTDQSFPTRERGLKP